MLSVSNSFSRLLRAKARQTLAIDFPVHSLDFARAKAWQILATVTLSIHSVHGAMTRLSLSHHTRSTLRDQAANTYCRPSPAMQATSPRTTHGKDYQPHRWHVPALQHLVLVRLTVRTSDNIDTPRLIQWISKTGTSICQRRPTPATHINHLAVSLPTKTISATDIYHLADSTNYNDTQQLDFADYVTNDK